MAEASIAVPVKYVDDITRCSICTDVYTDPRVLPCIHTYCLQCITRWGRDKQPGDSIACPLCRTEVKVPAGGFEEFQKNSFVENLLAVKKSSCRSSNDEKFCDVCADDADKLKLVEAAAFCIDCQQNLCQLCANYHKQLKVTRAHALQQLVVIKTQLNEPNSGSFCEIHPGESLSLYCFECRLAMCAVCSAESHGTHECVNVNEAASELRQKMGLHIGSVNVKNAEWKLNLKKLAKAKNDQDEFYVRIETEICKRADELTTAIDEYRDGLIEELGTRKKPSDKKVETAKEELERQMMMMESFGKYSEELLNKGTACDIVKAVIDLEARASELMKLDADVGSFLNRNLKFVSGPIYSKEIVQIFGHLVVDDRGRTLVPGVFPSTLQASHNLKSMGRAVRGIAILGDEVFVVRDRCPQIQVYAYDSLVQKRTLHVPDLAAATICGFAASSANRCIYFGQSSRSTVQKIEINGQDMSATKWTTSSGLYMNGLYVNSISNNVLILFLPSARPSESYWPMYEYTTCGTIVRKIKLQWNINTEPQHVIALENDEFGVTYSNDSKNARSSHGFIVLDADGKLIKSYSSISSGTGELKNPGAIAVNKRGFVFIADTGNNRIVVLNPNTFTGRVLPLSHQLNAPTCLILDEARDRLYIGEDEGGRVMVFDKVADLSFSA